MQSKENNDVSSTHLLFLTGIQPVSQEFKYNTVLFGQDDRGKSVVLRALAFRPFFYTELEVSFARILASLWEQSPLLREQVTLRNPHLARPGVGTAGPSKYTFVQAEDLVTASRDALLRFSKICGATVVLPSKSDRDLASEVAMPSFTYDLQTTSACAVAKLLVLFALWLDCKLQDCFSQSRHDSSGKRQRGSLFRGSDDAEEEELEEGGGGSGAFGDQGEFDECFSDDLESLSTMEREAESFLALPNHTLQDASLAKLKALQASSSYFVHSVRLVLKSFAVGYQDGQVQFLLEVRLSSTSKWYKVRKFFAEVARWPFAKPRAGGVSPDFRGLLSRGDLDVFHRRPGTYQFHVPPENQFLSSQNIRLQTWVRVVGAKECSVAPGLRSCFLKGNSVPTPYDAKLASALGDCRPRDASSPGRILDVLGSSPGRAATRLFLLSEQERLARDIPLKQRRYWVMSIRICTRHAEAGRYCATRFSTCPDEFRVVSVACQLWSLAAPSTRSKCIIFTTKKASEVDAGQDSGGDPYDAQWGRALQGLRDGLPPCSPAFGRFFKESKVFQDYEEACLLDCRDERELLAAFQNFFKVTDPEGIVHCSDFGNAILLLEQKGVWLGKTQNPQRRFFEDRAAFLPRGRVGRLPPKGQPKARSAPKSRFVRTPPGRHVLDIYKALEKAMLKKPLDTHELVPVTFNPLLNPGHAVDYPFEGGAYSPMTTALSDLPSHALRLVLELRALLATGPRFLNNDLSVSKLCKIGVSSVSTRGQQFRINSLLNDYLHAGNMVLNQENLLHRAFVLCLPQRASNFPRAPNLDAANPLRSFPQKPTPEDFQALSLGQEEEEGRQVRGDTLRRLCKLPRAAGAPRKGQQFVVKTKSLVSKAKVPNGGKNKKKKGPTGSSGGARTFSLSGAFKRLQGEGCAPLAPASDPETFSVRTNLELSCEGGLADHSPQAEASRRGKGGACPPGWFMDAYNSLGNSLPARCLRPLIDGDPSSTRNSGGYVREPEVNTRVSMVGTLDWMSLYPSIMMAFDLCLSSMLFGNSRDEIVRKVLDPDSLASGKYTVRTLPLDEENSVVLVLGKNGKKTRNLLPKILHDLQESRKESKVKMKQAASETERAVHNADQLAKKVTTNGVYGLFGFRQGQVYIPALCAVTAALGRWTIGVTSFFALVQLRPCEPGERDLLLEREMAAGNRETSIYACSARCYPFFIDPYDVHNRMSSAGAQGSPARGPALRTFGIVYGDTDSDMVCIRCPPSSYSSGSQAGYVKHHLDTFECLADAVTDFFTDSSGKKHLVLEFEDVKVSAIFNKPKCYTAYSAEPGQLRQAVADNLREGDVPRKLVDFLPRGKRLDIVTKGVAIKKRDRCPFVRDIAGPAIRLVMDQDWKGLTSMILALVEKKFFSEKQDQQQWSSAEYLSFSVRCDVDRRVSDAVGQIHREVFKDTCALYGVSLSGAAAGSASAAGALEDLQSIAPGQRVSYVVLDPNFAAKKIGVDPAKGGLKHYQQGEMTEVAILKRSPLDKRYYIFKQLLQSLKSIVQGPYREHYNALELEVTRLVRRCEQEGRKNFQTLAGAWSARRQAASAATTSTGPYSG